EARLCGLFPDRAAHDFAGADPLLDMTDGRPAGMIPDRLFDEWDEDEAAQPTPEAAQSTPRIPMNPHISPWNLLAIVVPVLLQMGLDPGLQTAPPATRPLDRLGGARR